MITVTIETPGLAEFVARVQGLAPGLTEAHRKAMRDSTLLVEAEAKARVHRRTGRLFSSISSEVTGEGDDLTGRVYTDVQYASDLEHGTKAHEIVAHGQALMLPISPMAGAVGFSGSIFGGARLSGAPRAGQQVAFFKSVHHPGTKAYPFMKPALEENLSKVEGIFQVAETAALDAVAKG